jgi:PAS domain S-box-containing protein
VNVLYALLALVVAALAVVLTIYTRSLLRAHTESVENERRFHQIADNIQEIFWMVDAETRKTLFVNQAYETITGRSCGNLQESPSSCQEAIHPEDRPHVLRKLSEATRSGHFEEKFRIVLPDGNLRWVWVRGFPVLDSDGRICRLVGTAQDITVQKQAEEDVEMNLALAKSAWAEAEALRRATLALTQNLRMDFVLDTLLESLTELIACESACIWFLEGDTHLVVAREKLQSQPVAKEGNYPLTMDAVDSPLLLQILKGKTSVLIPDTKQEADWKDFSHHAHLRSWLCVPLIASHHTLGLLSAGRVQPEGFNRDDLRRAQLLAIPAVAAIQNSRLYECASIYGSELEKRIRDVRQAKQALGESEESRKISEDKFQKVFRASPVALSITTIKEGRFLDVNEAFERRYGYGREELIGHTVHELRIWASPGDRVELLSHLHKGAAIRNVITRLRTKSGQIKFTAYSADRIQFDDQPCVLAVSDDLVDHDGRQNDSNTSA